MPPLAGRLISAGLASLTDLKTVLTLEDAYKLDEVLTLRDYHQWLVYYQQKDSRNG